MRQKHRALLTLAGTWTGDILVPLALYYGLRAAGLNVWWALLLGGVIPLGRTLHTFVRTRRVDRISGVILLLMVFGTAVSLLSGSPQLLMAREGWGTGVFGLWILSTTLRGGEPFLLAALYRILPADQTGPWADQWRGSAPFRRAIRAMNTWWGVAFVADAAARFAMAYTLPLDVVPVLSIGFLVAVLTVVHVVARARGRHAGISLATREDTALVG